MRNYAVIADLRVKTALHIEKAFDKGYEQGYEDGTKAKDGERGSIYYGGYGDGLKDGYEKGLKHGQKLRAKEAECAEACGMKRAWEAVRKIMHMSSFDLDDLFPGWDVEDIIDKLSAKEVIEKIEAWEKKQEQTKKNCKNCAHRISEKSNEKFFKCDAKGNCVNHEQWTPKQEEKQNNNIVPEPPLVSCYECVKYPSKCGVIFGGMKSLCTAYEPKDV